MIKNLVVSLLFLFLLLPLASSVFAADTLNVQRTIKPPVDSQDLVVSFRKGQSPQELEKAIQQRQDALSKSPFSPIQIWYQELTGKIPGISYYETKLKNIEAAEKKANVTNSKYSYSFQNGNHAYIMTVKKGTDVKTAIKILQALPEVDFVNRRALYFPASGSKIQSIEEQQTNLDQQIIVQYKKGYTPPEVAAKADVQAQIQSQPFGSLRIAASEALSGNKTDYGQVLENYAQAKVEANAISQDEYIPFEVKKPTPLEHAQVVTVESGSSQADAVKTYESLPEVEYAQIRPVKYFVRTPDDPRFDYVWGMQNIHAPEAWDTTTGSSNVIVATVDSGADYNHPDLADRIIKGADYLDGDSDPMDHDGHGTHVAGTIGAVGNNGIAITGVNWNVKVMAIRAIGEQGGDMIPGIEYAIQNGAKVINLRHSGCTDGHILPGQTCSQTEYNTHVDRATAQAFNDALNAGVTIVLAAGNGNEDAIYANPANYNAASGTAGKVIIVGAVGRSDERAAYSNYGSLVDIAAPGGNGNGGQYGCSETAAWRCLIYSTFPIGLPTPAGVYPDPNNPGYASMAGTSMATPHVAGAAGLLLSINPNLTPSEIRNILIQNADPISTDQSVGPRLNLARAVQATSGGNPPSPQPTTPDSTGTPSEAPTITQGASSGALKLSIRLPGIGSDENNNPTATRAVSVDFINQNGDVVKSATGNVTYGNGIYSGSISTDGVTPGTYQIRIKLNNTLGKLLPGFYTVVNSSTPINAPLVTLSSGDINNDSVLDLLDYNILIKCIQVGCDGDILQASDLDSNGTTEEKDLNIFLRQLKTRTGD